MKSSDRCSLVNGPVPPPDHAPVKRGPVPPPGTTPLSNVDQTGKTGGWLDQLSINHEGFSKTLYWLN